MKFDRTKMIEALREVVQRLNYPLDVMLVCVRWYAAYPLSFRNIEEIMAERGVVVDHSTLHRWAMKMLPGSEPRRNDGTGRTITTEPWNDKIGLLIRPTKI